MSTRRSHTDTAQSVQPLTIEPIGIIRTPYVEKYDAPRQPNAEGEDVIGVIELTPHRNFEQALDDLSGFDRIWIVSWFDRNTMWKPKVLPPRGGRTKRGVFATRSPHRPNPIGISVCRLLDVEGLRVRVANPDLLDCTPILDLKPYIPYADAFPDSASGWLASASTWHEGLYRVECSAHALQQEAWLVGEGVTPLLSRASKVLGRDPLPHSYRRTSQRADGLYEFAYKAWRIIYRLAERQVVIERIESGYAYLNASSRGDAPSPDASFHARFMLAEFPK
jgi:tRNA (adenine37-N6)-methyltransferase